MLVDRSGYNPESTGDDPKPQCIVCGPDLPSIEVTASRIFGPDLSANIAPLVFGALRANPVPVQDANGGGGNDGSQQEPKCFDKFMAKAKPFIKAFAGAAGGAVAGGLVPGGGPWGAVVGAFGGGTLGWVSGSLDKQSKTTRIAVEGVSTVVVAAETVMLQGGSRPVGTLSSNLLGYVTSALGGNSAAANSVAAASTATNLYGVIAVGLVFAATHYGEQAAEAVAEDLCSYSCAKK